MPETVGANVNLNTIISQIGGLIESFTGVPSEISGLLAELIEMHTDTNAKLESIRTEIADVQAVLGQALGGPETTMQSLLLQIRENTLCDKGKCGPGPDDFGGCSTPFTSTGTVASSDYGGRSFAIWNVGSLPTGITEGDFLAHDIAQAQLVHVAEGQWSLFVHSDGSPTFSISPDLDTLYPTNQWIDISSNLDLAINTPTGTDVTAYICVPSDFPFVECVDIDSSLTTFTHTVNGDPIDSDTVYAVPFSFIGGVTTASSMTYEDFGTQVLDFGFPGAVIVGDVEGWIITYESGEASQITLEYVTNLGSHQTTNLGAVSATFTIPTATSYFAISNRVASSPDTDGFQVSICPPAE